MTDPTRQVLETLFAAMEARDWATLGGLVADDVVYDLPQSGERIVGREAYVRFNADYPGDWHLAVRRLLAGDREASAHLVVTVDGAEQTAVGWYDLDAEHRIARVTEWWPEPYAPPDRSTTQREDP